MGEEWASSHMEERESKKRNRVSDSSDADAKVVKKTFPLCLTILISRATLHCFSGVVCMCIKCCPQLHSGLHLAGNRRDHKSKSNKHAQIKWYTYMTLWFKGGGR